MGKIVVGMFDELRHAQMALDELKQNGFSNEDISLVAGDTRGEYGKYFKDREGSKSEDASEGAAAGAGIGAVIGGLGGLLVGLGALAIPGIGPVIAAGPLISALAGAGIGAAAGGLLGVLVDAGIPEEQAKVYEEGVRRGHTLVTIRSSDERASQAVDILNRHNPIDVEQRAREWRDSGWSGQDLSAQAHTGQSSPAHTGFTSGEDMSRHETRREDEVTFPVVEEELRVGKREVEEGGIRARTVQHQEDVEETVNVRQERVDVERRPVDRPATEEDLSAFREGTVEMTERSEEVVVDKRPRVTEEVTIRKEVEEHPETVRETLLHQDVEVERTDMGERMTSGDFAEYEPFFRNHYDNAYTMSGYTYDTYQPAYRYGYELAREDRYRDWDWNRLESSARRDWEMRHPESAWDQFKDAVRTSWERVKSSVS